VLEGIDKRGVGVGKATSYMAKVIYTRRCHVKMIEKDGAKGKTWWAICLFHIAPLERRAEPGTCGFRCSASNRGDGSVYDRDDCIVMQGRYMIRLPGSS
jgi:hypothetical protein